LFYLVKGSGQAYAAVAQHVMIVAPLHLQLVKPIEAGDHFRWVEHNMKSYQGLPAHVEFTAAAGSDFAVAMVVQAKEAPGSVGPVNHLLLKMLADNANRSPADLAGAYQRLLLDVADRLATDRIRDKPQATDYARLADRLLQHPELVMPADGAASERWRAAADAFVARQTKLLAEIKPESRLAPALWDGSGYDEHVFLRGSYKTPGALAPRRFLEALAGPEPLAVNRGSGRLELARQMTDPERNPYLARVMVNRIWYHVFGRGLVASPDNLGILGEPPTHPELLDHLADRFIREGWSVKKMIRALVLSSSYQMA